MRAVIKWTLVALAALVVVVGVFLTAYLMDWAYWKVAVVLAVLLVLGALAVLALRLRESRSRAKPDEQALPGAQSDASRQELAERRRALDASWKAFLGQLRQSRVRGKGDPVYALPWFLILGEDGAGKTSAVRNSLRAVPSAAGPGGAANGEGLSWHILEDAIVLEVPGHYAFPRSEVDEAEWGEFLSLVVHARRDEPLNGIIVAVAADELSGGAEGELKVKAVTLGKRLDEITRKLGVVVPVYLLITKCDLVGGMARFFGYLPEAAFTGAMGALSDERGSERPRETFLEEVFDRLYEDLRQLRLIILGDVPPDEVHPETVLFPEEFLELKEPLGKFVDVLFEKNPYREPPFFRGLYFVSGRQEGLPASECLARLGLQEETLPLPGEGRSLFLKGVFGQVLPRDRALVVPTSRAVSWRRLTQNAALAGWILVCVGVGIALSVSFGRNLSTIREIDREVPRRGNLGAEFGPNLDFDEQLRGAVVGARERQRAWVLPRFGLDQGDELEARMARVFVSRFGENVLGPLDKDLDRELLAVSDGKDPSLVARYVDYLSKRTRLLKMAVDGERSEETLAKEPQPDFSLVLRLPAGQDVEKSAEAVQRGYLSYLAWRGDRDALGKDLETEQKRLANLLSQKAIGFGWLTEWANLQQSIPSVTLAQYWGAEPPSQGEPPVTVRRAYTPAGWKAISDFIATISRSVTGGEGVGAALNSFELAYRKQYLSEWQRFLARFDEGAAGWSGRQKQVELAGRLAGPSSPYARLLADCPGDLAPAVGLAKNLQDVPEWVSLVYRYERLNDPQYQKALKGGQGVVARLASRGGQLLADLKARLRDQTSDARLMQQDAEALTYLAAYRETLQQMASSTQAPAAAFNVAKDAYGEAETRVGEPKDPVSRNFWAQGKLSGALSQGRPAGEVFWRLLSEPAEDVWGVVLQETEVYVQQKWEEEVLAEGKNLAGWDLVDTLEGEGGKVWTFQNKYLDPFLTKEPRRGYVPKKLYNDALDFSNGFLHIANLGAPGSKAFDRSYRVEIAAEPTSANPGATVQPHRTRLVLRCSEGNQELVNLNYPIEKAFNWNPGACSDMVLEIAVGDTVLTNRYPGYNGFLKFLHDFRSGSRVFRAAEFPPAQQAALRGYGVKNITVRYRFKGRGAALRLAEYNPTAVPARLFE